MTDFASHIKAVDPGALVVGPEEWGWSGNFYSGYDQQYGSLHGWSFLPDRTNHGGQDYLPWLLGQIKTDGRHLLDVFSVHYPQGGEFGNDVSTAMQLLRNKSTRSGQRRAVKEAVPERFRSSRAQPRLRNREIVPTEKRLAAQFAA